MRIEIDTKWRINQWNHDTYIGFVDLDTGFSYSLFIDSKIKRNIRRKYGGLTDFVEKFHCLSLYYLIDENINKISEMKICRDISKKKLLKYLKDHFSNSSSYDKIKKNVKSVGKASKVHKFMKKLKKRDVKLKLTNSMITEKLKR